MKNLYLLLLLPFSVWADYLTTTEIDQLVDSAFNRDLGSQNVYVSKNHERPAWPFVVFVNIEEEEVEVKKLWIDEINNVTAELQQLTGVQFTVRPELRTWTDVRSIMIGNALGSVTYNFLDQTDDRLGGQDGNVKASRTSIKININAKRQENIILHLIREELANGLGLLGDTWRDPESIFYQGGSYTTEFTETDRRIIYAYFHFDKNETTGWPPKYDEETFREKIAKFPIDDEKVYQGLFADKLPFRPGWLYYNHYPWVYCGRSNSWYYLCANQDGSFLWSERSKQWSLMGDVFKLN